MTLSDVLPRRRGAARDTPEHRDTPEPGATTGWQSTYALRRGLLVGAALVVVGLLVNRGAAVLIGAPLLLSGVLAAMQLPERSRRTPTVRVRPAGRQWQELPELPLVLEIDGVRDADYVAVRLPRGDQPAPGPVHVLAPSVRSLACPSRPVPWGHHVVAAPDHLLAGPDAGMVYGPVVGVEAHRVVLPPVQRIPAGPLPPRPAGLVGGHRSPRPGESTDLREIRAFSPGDRVRRVDWRVSLRSQGLESGQLYVRTMHADADADVVLAVDTGVDVGPELAGWTVRTKAPDRPRGGSLREAGTAATALAATHLRAGDRVGFADLGNPVLSMPARAGQRQLLAIRLRLVRCLRSAGRTSTPALPAHRVPAGAVVVVLSPFLDDAVAQLAVTTARRGSPVLAVDVLPPTLLADPDEPWGAATLNLLRAQRRARLDGLTRHGVAVLSWGDAAVVAATLRQMMRRPAGVRR